MTTTSIGVASRISSIISVARYDLQPCEVGLLIVFGMCIYIYIYVFIGFLKSTGESKYLVSNLGDLK